MANWYQCIICKEIKFENNFNIFKNGLRNKKCNLCENIRRVKRIKPIGIQSYPTIKNIDTGEIYVDISLETYDNKKICDEQGYDKYGHFVNYKGLKGAWHTFSEEPEYPLKENIEFLIM